MAKTLSRRSLLWGSAAASAGSVWLAAACGQVAAPTMEPATEEEAPKAAEEAAKPMEAKTVTALFISNDQTAVDPFWGKTVVDRFQEQNPSITVDWSAPIYREVSDKVNTQLAAGAAPDVFHHGIVLYPQRRDAGHCFELTNYYKRDAADFEDVIAQDWGQDPDGTYWVTQINQITTATAYNKAIFDKYGLNPPGGSLTWNPDDGGEFVDVAREITQRSSVETDQIWGFFNNKQVTADVLGFLGQNGATFLSEDHTKSTMHEPEFIEVIQFLWNLEFKWRVSPTADDVAAITENVEPGKAYHAPFAYQRTAMMNLLLGQESAWGSPQVEEMPIHAVPMVKGKVDKVPAVGACFYLWSQTKVPDEGWELMKFYVTDDESQLGQYTINNYGLPVKRTVWDNSRLQTEKSRPPRELDAYLEPLRTGAFFTFQINAVWLPYIRAFGAHRARAWNQEATVEEAMRDASKEVQALLDEYYADK